MPSLNPTIANINSTVVAYTPAIIAGIQAAESVAGATGPQKLQAVVNGVLGESAALSGSSNPNIAGIAALTNLFVSIFNSLGLFNHAAPAPAVKS